MNGNLRSNRGSSRSQSQGSQHVLLKLEEKNNDVAQFVTVGTAVLKHLHPTTTLVMVFYSDVLQEKEDAHRLRTVHDLVLAAIFYNAPTKSHQIWATKLHSLKAWNAVRSHVH